MSNSSISVQIRKHVVRLKELSALHQCNLITLDFQSSTDQFSKMFKRAPCSSSTHQSKVGSTGKTVELNSLAQVSTMSWLNLRMSPSKVEYSQVCHCLLSISLQETQNLHLLMYGKTHVPVLSMRIGMHGSVKRSMQFFSSIVSTMTEWIDQLNQFGYMDTSLIRMAKSSKCATKTVNASRIGLMLSWTIVGMVSIPASRENRDSLPWFINQLILIGSNTRELHLRTRNSFCILMRAVVLRSELSTQMLVLMQFMMKTTMS